MSSEIEDNCFENATLTNKRDVNENQTKGATGVPGQNKKQQMNLCLPQASHSSASYSFSVSEMPSLNFQNQLKIQINSNKNIKICMVFNILLSLICLTWLSVATIKLNKELMLVQDHVSVLNDIVQSLSTLCNTTSHTARSDIKIDLNPQQLVGTISRSDTVEKIEDDADSEYSYDYDYMDYDEAELTTDFNRNRRASRRGKNKSRKRKQTGTLAVHFKGSIPELLVDNQGLIGPWYPDNTFSQNYKFPRFHLTEGSCSVEVTESALYMIYAQMYYVTSSASNSYSIYVKSEGSSHNSVIAKCSASGPNSSHTSELSCYTSAIYNLKRNDRILIQQTERNRTIILRDGHSFFGLVRLNNFQHKK